LIVVPAVLISAAAASHAAVPCPPRPSADPPLLSIAFFFLKMTRLLLNSLSGWAGTAARIEPGWIRREKGASMSTDNLSPEEQQARWLEEGKAVVKQQAFLMFAPRRLRPQTRRSAPRAAPYPRLMCTGGAVSDTCMPVMAPVRAAGRRRLPRKLL